MPPKKRPKKNKKRHEVEAARQEEAELNEAIQRSLETQEVYPCRSQLEFMEKKERIFFPVLGDGDCLLYSILALLRYDPQWQEVHHPYADLISIELREKMLEWFIENKDTIVWAPNEEGVPVHQAVLQNAEGFSDCLFTHLVASSRSLLHH